MAEASSRNKRDYRGKAESCFVGFTNLSVSHGDQKQGSGVGKQQQAGKKARYALLCIKVKQTGNSENMIVKDLRIFGEFHEGKLG